MWTTYTRETPAKPAWTIATMAIAFLVTVAAAQWLVSSHRPGAWEEAMRADLPEWPFTFALPKAVDEWKRSVDSGDAVNWLRRYLSVGGPPYRKVSYHGFDHQQLSTFVHVGCAESGGEFDLRAIKKSLGFADGGRQRSITMGGVDGVMESSRDAETDLPAIFCHAKLPGGETVVLFVTTNQSRLFAEAVAKWICESMRERS